MMRMPMRFAAGICAAALAAMLSLAGFAGAQPYYPPPYRPYPAYQPFAVQPAMPETMPTWSQDEMSGTAQHNIAATPDCGAANPQGGIPSMTTGTCP